MKPIRSDLVLLRLVADVLLFAVLAAGSAEAASFDRNALPGEASPYLQQHRNDPVHWQPWSDAVFAEARRSGRPVFLSIGYSACYWCHVMQEDNFENPATAALINEFFLPVLVDREERPDMDQFYQIAVSSLGGISGWPLNVFLDGDGNAFFGAGYFPPKPMRDMPAFPELLRSVHGVWAEDRENVETVAKSLAVALGRRTGRETMNLPLLDMAAEDLLSQVDPFAGGFGDAPKYPYPFHLELLWRHALRRGSAAATMPAGPVMKGHITSGPWRR